ncbi:MAG TPA: amidohydrolase family protein [Candidatus Dormibacteraeota bacterium]|nr:amidohydrolase family protein [Candidatus Dormibacteraeota bacterium]
MSVLFRDALLWDGLAPEPRPHMDVLVDDGTVTEVRSSSQARGVSDEHVVDLGGACLMPGLIDMHVHVMWSGSPDPVSVVDSEGEQLTGLRAVANAQAQLRSGVTTVRDLGSNWDLAISVSRAVSRGYIEGPRVVAAGRTIIMTGGHDPFWGIAADGPDAVLRAVRTQIYAGAGIIKVAATGGVYGRPEGEEIGQSELSYEELAVAAGEAHRFGLKVASHALGSRGIADSVRAGVDTIEHGIFLTEEIVAEMKRRGTALTPTLHIYRTIADGEGAGIPAYAVEKARKAVRAHREGFHMAMEAGVPIVAGTDAGSCNTPHPSLIQELRCLRDYGMPTDAVLRAATSAAAAVLGKADAFGTVEPGKAADLLVVDGNPIDRLDDLLRVRYVMRAGRLVSAPAVMSR